MLLTSVAVTNFGSEAGALRSDLNGKATPIPTQVRPAAFSLKDPHTVGVLATNPDAEADRQDDSQPPSDPSAGNGQGTPTSTDEGPQPGLPLRIAIPSLKLDAEVVQVGLEDDGAMEIPSAIEAGWYELGPRPGSALGSAVIAGHVDHKKSPGVFLELRSLELGSEVAVTDDAGDVHRFVVTERFQVAKGELPVQALFQRDGDPVLTLITCGGRFDRKARSYDDNIVIRAIPADVNTFVEVGRERL